MKDLTEVLTYEEKIPLKLRALYEKYGYRKYHMGKFEQYDVYRENKNFLKSESIITFTNANGKLMALKPDVTISIVKNTKEDVKSQKLYYMENVFRMEYGSKEYREISQLGIENIGADGDYAEAEVISLALQSLDAIGSEYKLNINHMGYITGLLDGIGLNDENKEKMLREIKQKNLYEIDRLASLSGVTEKDTELLLSVATIFESFDEALEKMNKVILNDDMKNAVCELKALKENLDAIGNSKNIQIDFSVINDIDYYNGLVFQGYIKEAPRAVLAGGRYDNLMRRFDKPQSALGFALYLGELDRAFHTLKEYDVDVLLVYGESRAKEITEAVNKLFEKGLSVRAEKEFSEEIRAKEVLVLRANGQTEVFKNA